MKTILDEIVHSKRAEVAAAKHQLPLENLFARVTAAAPPRDFRGALAGGRGIRLIAEIKKASPSAQTIRHDFDPVSIARIYEQNGASCLSVLTDTPYFQGCLDYLTQVSAEVQIPVLRKDFVIDDYQVFEARAAGADAILLIAEILDDASLERLRVLAESLGMSALVEFHDEANLSRAVGAGSTLIGINNRNLRNFTTDIDHTLRLRDRIPASIIVVSESGIRDRADVERLEAAGISAILVGESLMRAPDLATAVARLLGQPDEATLGS
jgi:indole-3-glycerol phosphate synthase